MAKRVLLADDSITIQKVVELTLSDQYDVKCVGDGSKAIEQLEAFQPDVVILDATMPQKDGYEVCTYIRSTEAYQHLPVMILHGAFESFDEAQAREAGANEIVTKPFDSDALINKIEALLALDLTPASSTPEDTAEPPSLESTDASLAETVDQAFDSYSEASNSSSPSETPADASPPSPEEASLQSNETSDSPKTEESPSKEVGTEISTQAFEAAQSESSDTVQAEPEPQASEAAAESEKTADAETPADSSDSEETPAKESERPQEEAAATGNSPKSSETKSGVEGEANPVSYYDPPEKMTPADAAYARDMMDSSSVSSEEMGLEASSSKSETSEPDTEDEAPAISSQELLEPPPAPAEEMPTAELLKDVGDSSRPAELSDEEIDRIAARVIAKVSEKLIREIAWEVVPDLAEVLIKKKIDDIEKGTGD